MAHVPDLAGCAATGPDRASALAALTRAVHAYLAWCAEHGEPLSGDGAIVLEPVEVVAGCRPWQPGGANALFSVDRMPLGDPELRAYLRRMGYARGDLLALTRALSPGQITSLLAGQAVTVHDVLSHIADYEVWLLSRLGRRIEGERPDADVFQHLIDTRAQAVESVLRLAPRQRDLVYVPTDRPSENPDEAWTLRKVLRILLEHELRHLTQIRSSLGDNVNTTH